MSAPDRAAPAAGDGPVLELRGVGFAYGATQVLDGIDLTIAHGELVVCIGPSGAGKTTLVGLLGGHLAPTTGTLVRRGTSRTIHQDGGLFPWLTARENIEAGLPRGLPPGERGRRAAEWIAITRLGGFADHYPHQLSGGMRQRVELARALAGETDVLLLDEPLGALDYQTRAAMRRELTATLAARPRTVVLVTHDLEEALELADRVVVLSARPARVHRVLPVAMPRPRLRSDPAVAALEATLRSDLHLPGGEEVPS